MAKERQQDGDLLESPHHKVLCTTLARSQLHGISVMVTKSRDFTRRQLKRFDSRSNKIDKILRLMRLESFRSTVDYSSL